jgi:peptide-methionine (S)-S-oxide reductase
MVSLASCSTKLALGAGCYWGTEKFVVKDFQKLYPGSIAKASVGFMSPDPNAMVNPTYRQVCSGSTGHVEVLHVELTDPSATLEPLLRFFFQFHDPTTKNRQGNDTGTQYASVIFCGDEQQRRVAEKVKAEVQALVDAGKIRYAGKKVETMIADLNPYYPAHEEHQRYLEKNPLGYCNHFYRFKEWPEN